MKPFTTTRTCFLSCVFAVLNLLAIGGCNGKNNEAATDLLNAFQTGCTLDGQYLQLALSQTQSIATTVQDLETDKSCAGVNGALSTINNMQTQISSINSNAFSSQMSNLSSIQKILMLQLSQSTDPNVISTLAEAYANNLLDMGEAQSGLLTTGLGLTQGNDGTGLPQTSFETGSMQLNSYLQVLLADQTNISQCAEDDPALAAEVAAGMIGVAGSFTPTVAGTALSLAGGVFSSIIGFIHGSGYVDEVDNLNQIQMSAALPCGLEQMADTYCQAQDIMDITHLEECSYNPQAPDCQPTNTNTPNAKVPAQADQFWQGLDVLDRELPALQLWLNHVVTGITPPNPFDAQAMNTAENNVAAMDSVARLAQGVMEDEEAKIATLTDSGDQTTEVRNGLAILQAVLACNTNNTSVVNSFNGGCENTPILAQEGTATQILYDLVGLAPPTGCDPASQISQNCANAQSIPLPPGVTPLDQWHSIEAYAGGLPDKPTAGKDLIDTTLKRQLALEHQYLDTDPSNLLGEVNTPAGEGLPSPIKALTEVDTFLKASYTFFADTKQVPDSMLDGGPAMRPGILGLLASTEQMVSTVVTDLGKMNGVDDLETLTNVYKQFQLDKDRNFVYNRVLDRIQADIHTRIKAGQIPSNIYDILSQAQVDPTVGLLQIPPEQMEATMASLGQAQTTAQANAKEFASFFAKSFNGVLQFLKQQADADGEPANASDPRKAPNRANQARLCLLLVTTQTQWPSGIDASLCSGLAYQSELTGESLNFDTFYAQLQNGSTKLPQRMCSFYHFYRESQNYTHPKQGQ